MDRCGWLCSSEITSPHCQSSKTQEAAGKEIVFTTQSEEDADKAQKAAAVKAMEAVFARKKKLAEEKAQREALAAAELQGGDEEVESIPVPVKRTSIKKKTEYTSVTSSSGGTTKPTIRMGDFSSSGTDYKSLSKMIQ